MQTSSHRKSCLIGDPGQSRLAAAVLLLVLAFLLALVAQLLALLVGHLPGRLLVEAHQPLAGERGGMRAPSARGRHRLRHLLRQPEKGPDAPRVHTLALLEPPELPEPGPAHCTTSSRPPWAYT